ncbi:thermonuclease family protein [Algibacter sp. PT7-4]|uniref:thermonuclease family protein n=1 Tax=Algibacter ulvanivorans TaxID=3400999 RepID=UPI003AAF92A9
MFIKKVLYCLFLFSYLIANAQKVKKENHIISGKVTAITDGDTFKLLTKDSILIKVRLANIDAPERKQPFSKKAKQFVSQAIFRKHINIYVLKKDRYGRYIANVMYNDSLNLNFQLVKNGLAWHYTKYSTNQKLQDIENLAKKKKKGLWVNSKSISPWQWRANKKEANRLKKLTKSK